MSSLSGKYYYEATVTDEGLCRVGWSTDLAALDLGQFITNLTMCNSKKFPIPQRGRGQSRKKLNTLFWLFNLKVRSVESPRLGAV